MSTELVPVKDLRVVAFDPQALQQSQQQLISWAKQKIAEVEVEMDDLHRNIEIARAAKWSMKQPKAALQKAADRHLFLQKVSAALEAGYYIVPDFPCDLFAIRTSRETPFPNAKTSDWKQSFHIVPAARAQLLPVGEGEYKSPTTLVTREAFLEEKPDGKEVEKYEYRSTKFCEIDFPFVLARPEILDATQQALALKIFDEVGSAPATRKADPMVVGIIRMPKRGWQDPKQLTFLVAWFIDTKTI